MGTSLSLFFHIFVQIFSHNIVLREDKHARGKKYIKIRKLLSRMSESAKNMRRQNGYMYNVLCMYVSSYTCMLCFSSLHLYLFLFHATMHTKYRELIGLPNNAHRRLSQTHNIINKNAYIF